MDSLNKQRKFALLEMKDCFKVEIHFFPLEVKYLEMLEKFICRRNQNDRFCVTLKSTFLDPRSDLKLGTLRTKSVLLAVSSGRRAEW